MRHFLSNRCFAIRGLQASVIYHFYPVLSTAVLAIMYSLKTTVLPQKEIQFVATRNQFSINLYAFYFIISYVKSKLINLTLVIPMCIWTNKCESNSV